MTSVIQRHEKFFLLIALTLPYMFYMNIGIKINTSISDVFIFVSIMYLLLLNRTSNTKKKLLTIHLIPLTYFLLLIFIAAISLFIANISETNLNNFYGIFNIIKLLISFLYFSLFLNYFNKNGVLKFLKFWIIGSLIFSSIAIISLFLYIIGIDTGLTYGERLSGSFEDPNLAGAYLILSLGLSIFHFYKIPSKFSPAVYMVYIISILLTASRTAFVALSFFLVFYLIILLLKLKIKNLIFILLISIILLSQFENIKNMDYFEFAVNRVTNISTEDTGTNYRISMWKNAIKMGVDNIAFGVGSGQYVSVAPQYLGYKITTIPHNTYLTFFSETGLLGFLVFISLPFLIFIKTLIGSINSQEKSILAILIISMSIVAISINIENFRGLWILFALSYHIINKKTNNTKHNLFESNI